MLTKNKHILYIISVISAGIGLVVMLAWASLKPISQNNGFNRKFAPKKVTLRNVIDKSKEITGISGATTNHLYFNTRTPGRILATSINLVNEQYLYMAVPNEKKVASTFQCSIDSPWVYIMAGSMPAVITGEIGAKGTIHKHPSALFTRAVIIGKNTYVVRGFDKTVKNDQILIKGNYNTGELYREENLTERNGNGGLTTDGLLHYDRKTNTLIYVNFYRNQFLCIDTNLNLKFKGHTIDTVSTYQTIAGSLTNGSKKTITNISPSRVVNGVSSVADGKIYITSKLKADNEARENFMRNSIVDIYSVNTGEYEGSFYIPFYKDEKLTSFKVIKDIMIVLYKKHIVTYSLF